MKKYIKIFVFICITILMFYIYFCYKTRKNGNNISNKSANEIAEYILNIESYKAIATVNIKSNKNENNYKLKQKYNKEQNIYEQEVIEPEAIQGIKFIYSGESLKIENTKLNLNKIYTNYQYIEANELSLIAFIEDFKKDKNAKYYEENDKIIMETNTKYNRYNNIKKLYISKDEGKIDNMEIIDKEQNVKIYILYNEIEVNTTSKEEVLAFSMETLEQDI